MPHLDAEDPKHLAEAIQELSTELEQEFSEQAQEDVATALMLQRREGIEVGKGITGRTQNPDDAVGPKAVRTGYPGLIVLQDYAFLTTPAFLRVNAADPAHKRESSRVENGLLGAAMLSQGIDDVELLQNFDFVWAGRGWSNVYPAPYVWGGPEWKMIEGEEIEEYNARVAKMKADAFPILWRHVEVQDTWPTFDHRGELDQVTEIRRMTARQIRKAYGPEFVDDRASDRETFRVLEYADDRICSVVILRSGTNSPSEPMLAKGPWSHDLRMNPYILAQAPPAAPRTAVLRGGNGTQSSAMSTGIRWQGVLFHSRDSIKEINGILSDAGYNFRQATRAQSEYYLDPELRGQSGNPEEAANQQQIEEAPYKPIYLWNTEKRQKADPARTNIDGFRLLEIHTSFTREISLRPALLGVAQSGTSGTLYNTLVQFAQKQFGPALRSLERTAVRRSKLFLRCVESLGEDVPVLFTDAKGKCIQIVLKPTDAENWERSTQARVELAVPINESQNVLNAKAATDPANPVLSRESVMGRWLNVEDTEAEEDAILDDQVMRAIAASLVAEAGQQALGLINAPEQDVGAMGQRLAALQERNPAIVQAITTHAAKLGTALPEVANELRGQQNVRRTGRLQRPTQQAALTPEPTEP